jgi:hypothetical protein
VPALLFSSARKAARGGLTAEGIPASGSIRFVTPLNRYQSSSSDELRQTGGSAI